MTLALGIHSNLVPKVDEILSSHCVVSLEVLLA
jgi:hypothetical protein